MNASTIASAMVTPLDSPRAVPMITPSTSPMAQPVRQCRVALRAIEVSAGPEVGSS